MTDDLDPLLRAARPHTAADDGWAASADGARMLRTISTKATSTRTRRWRATADRHRPPLAYLAAVAAVVVLLAGGLTWTAVRPGTGTAAHRSHQGQRPGGPPVNPRPQQLALVSYASCGSLLADLRRHTAARVTAYGLPGSGNFRFADDALSGTAPTPFSSSGVPQKSNGSDSTTNDQEAGVDEPDPVKTEPGRVVSMSGGVLRVIDTATRAVTARLDLTAYAGAQQAKLLLDGDRALVILGSADTGGYLDGPHLYGGFGYGEPETTAYLLVDLHAAPRIVATVHPNGAFVAARLIDGTIRLVARSTPDLTFPARAPHESTAHRRAANRAIVAHAPLRAWLPGYDLTVGGTTTTHRVPCRSVSRPAQFTGTSLLTVYTLGLVGIPGDLQPVTLAADSDTVYATTTDLYLTSQRGSHGHGGVYTQLHRFTIAGNDRPTYVGSGSVPGRLLSSYSLSAYRGQLRVVTTRAQDTGHSSASVFVLDASTLRVTGHLDGLGHRESVYAVRFAGPLAYVVTFRRVDPLFVVDLSDPAHPRRAGEVALRGYSGYLHPTGDGRLLGVGSLVGHDSEPNALQVSLFDVSRPDAPRRIAQVVRHGTPSGVGGFDPHAFLFWPGDGTTVVPTNAYRGRLAGAVLVLRVQRDALTAVGTIRNPATADGSGAIQRSLIVDGDIWTISADGIVVSNRTTLHRRAMIAFG